jgi:hypothetical protein
MKITKGLLVSGFYSIVIFCVVSYISVMTSLIKSAGHVSIKPVSNIGFPFKYYYQFWLNGSDSPNCGWQIKYFIYDFFIVWIITTIVYFIVNIRIKTHNNIYSKQGVQ